MAAMCTRLLACLLVVSSGCGSDDTAPTTDAPPGTIDSSVGPDAPPGSADATPGADASAGCTPVSGTPALGLEEVATGFDMPLFVTSPPGDPRLFVVEKTGGIWIID